MTAERNTRNERDLNRTEKNPRQAPSEKQERNPSQQRDQRVNQDHQSNERSSGSKQNRHT